MTHQWWLSFALLPALAFANTQLETTTVVGYPIRLSDPDLSRSSANVTVIERAQFADQKADLADVLRQHAGLQVNQSGAIGSYSSVSIRGASHQQLQIYLDGIPLNSAQGGSIDLSQINLQSLQRIDIYRGMVPAEFAQSNVAGVIHLHSRSQKNSLELSQMIGSFNSRRTDLGAHYQTEGSDTQIHASVQSADNDFSFLNINQTPLNAADDYQDTMPYNQFKQNHWLLKQRYQLSEQWQGDWLLQRTFSQQQLPPALHINRDTGADLETETWQFNARLEAHQLWHNRVDWQPGVYMQRKQQHFIDPYSRVGLLTNDNQMDIQSWGTQQLFGLHWHPDWTHTIALSWNDQDYQNQDAVKQNRYQVDVQRFDLTQGVQWQPEDWTLSAQWRYSREQQQAQDNNHQIHKQGLSLGLHYPLSDAWQLKANTGEYYRLPTLEERFGDRGYSIGNSQLKAETSHNSDLGLHYWSVQWQGSTTLFYRDLDNYIYPHFNSQGVSQARNLERVTVQGIEGELQWQPVRWLSQQLQWTWQDSTYHSQQKAFDGKQTPLLFHRNLQYRIQLQQGNWSGYVSYQMQNHRFYDTTNLVETPRRETVDAQVSWQDQQWRITLQGQNLTNQLNRSDLGDFYNYPLPSRAYYVTLSYRY